MQPLPRSNVREVPNFSIAATVSRPKRSTRKAAAGKRAAGKRATDKAKVPAAVEIRNALPFFRKKKGSQPASWWSVEPTGHYAKDLETGRDYARAFLPLLIYNGGASDLGVIVSHMTQSGQKLENGGHRAVDDVAFGFLLELGGIMQGLLGCVGVAASAIKHRDRKMASNFVKVVENGSIYKGLSRATLFHNPNATIFDKAGAPAR